MHTLHIINNYIGIERTKKLTYRQLLERIEMARDYYKWLGMGIGTKLVVRDGEYWLYIQKED